MTTRLQPRQPCVDARRLLAPHQNKSEVAHDYTPLTHAITALQFIMILHFSLMVYIILLHRLPIIKERATMAQRRPSSLKTGATPPGTSKYATVTVTVTVGWLFHGPQFDSRPRLRNRTPFFAFLFSLLWRGEGEVCGWCAGMWARASWEESTLVWVACYSCLSRHNVFKSRSVEQA